jgi:hypothetical protein
MLGPLIGVEVSDLWKELSAFILRMSPNLRNVGNFIPHDTA